MHLPIIKEQPEITGACSIYPWSDKLAERLTLTSRFDEEVELYEKIGNGLIKVPRQLCPIGKEDHRVGGPKTLFPGACLAPRNFEQKRIWSEAGDLLDEGESFVLEAPTGFGKTVTACELIARMKTRTLVIVPKTDLMHGKDQWVDAFKEFLGLQENQIGFIQGDKCEVLGKKVVLGMLKSLSIKGKYPISILKEFGFIIWDEVHRLPATTFSKTAGMFPALLRMGLSATPERLDGKEFVFQAHIGPVAVKSKALPMKPIVATYTSKWKNPRDNRGRKINGTPGKMGYVLTVLTKDSKRNKLINQLILRGYKKGRHTVVFSDRVEHLETLRSIACTSFVPVHDTALYVSKSKKSELDAASGKKVIFATYAMMGEGTNIPWLDCCILATPRANVKQFIGRILREYPDKEQPVILDILDFDNKIFVGFAYKRKMLYKEMGADFFKGQGK